jgi:uncharacterized membrane protein YdbT with pleckstrin-like domain
MQPELVVRPSTKLVMVGFVVASALMVAGAVTVYVLEPSHKYWWIGLLPGLAYDIALMFQFLALMTEKLTFNDDHLHHEVGFIAKTTRTINLAKVQDVTVAQNIKQRLMGMGRISVETSGGSSAIVVDNVDNPHKIAEMILDKSRQSPQSRL